MTEEELRDFEGKIIDTLYIPEQCMMFSEVWLETKAKKIITLTEQYYREAGYKSPHEVKSLVFNAILHADDKQKEAIREGYKNCSQCDATNVKKEGPSMDEQGGE